MPLLLLYVIAITLICFISIILTETPQKLTANSDSDSENQLAPKSTMDNLNSRIDVLGISTLSNIELGEQPKAAEEPATEPYHYF